MTNTPADFIKEVLEDNASIAALVGTRIYHGLLPQVEQQLPYIVFYQIDAPNLEGNAERERWQVSIRAKTITALKTLAFLVRSAFNNLQGAYTGFDVQMCYYDSAQFFQEEWEMYHAPLDFFIFYIRT